MKLELPSSNESRAVSSSDVDCDGSAASDWASSSISPRARSVAAGSSAISAALSGWTMLVPADSTIELNQTTRPS